MANATRETHLSGLPLSGGLGVARVCMFNDNRHRDLPAYKVSGTGVAGERARFDRALARVAARLDGLHQDVAERLGPAEAEIFVAQKMLLEDAAISREVHGAIESRRCNAETAVTAVFDLYESRLQEVDDEYIKDRASDIGEVRRRLLDALANTRPALQCAPGSPHCQRGKNRIIVAAELTPSLTLELDTEFTIGFVTERGGINSHAAILARALGIPAVSGINGIRERVSCGTEILLNGQTGEVVINPAEATVARALAAAAGEVRHPTPVAAVPELQVLASISRVPDLDNADRMLAEGVGLYRTEFEFLACGRVLGEDEQTALYTAVVKRLNGRPLYLRVLDIGGDKPLPTLNVPHENNPHLGYRGARLLLGKQDLLQTQARAVARASAAGRIQVMYPMVTGTRQFLELRRLFAEATADIAGADVMHGAMLEVPSACLEVRELLRAADFASVGSNDLVQYLFAVDRDNELVAYDYTPDVPVLWTLLTDLAAAARAARKPLSICGEIAGNPAYVPRLLQAGFNSVSVSPRLIPGVRLAVHRARDN